MLKAYSDYLVWDTNQYHYKIFVFNVSINLFLVELHLTLPYSYIRESHEERYDRIADLIMQLNSKLNLVSDVVEKPKRKASKPKAPKKAAPKKKNVK
jgi:hypothetical protein